MYRATNSSARAWPRIRFVVGCRRISFDFFFLRVLRTFFITRIIYTRTRDHKVMITLPYDYKVQFILVTKARYLGFQHIVRHYTTRTYLSRIS